MYEADWGEARYRKSSASKFPPTMEQHFTCVVWYISRDSASKRVLMADTSIRNGRMGVFVVSQFILGRLFFTWSTRSWPYHNLLIAASLISWQFLASMMLMRCMSLLGCSGFVVCSAQLFRRWRGFWLDIYEFAVFWGIHGSMSRFQFHQYSDPLNTSVSAHAAWERGQLS